jgi:methyltransferase
MKRLLRPHVADVAIMAVAAQRLVELRRSSRNERRMRDAGAVEHGAGHYPVMVMLHAGWLLATLVEVHRAPAAVGRAGRTGALATFAAAQALRWWAIRSLGERWTTRVLVVPGAELVRAGPYRIVDHPNYIAVAGEIAAFPAALGAPRTAAAFSAANAFLLAHRIRIESAALRRRC